MELLKGKSGSLLMSCNVLLQMNTNTSNVFQEFGHPALGEQRYRRRRLERVQRVQPAPGVDRVSQGRGRRRRRRQRRRQRQAVHGEAPQFGRSVGVI